LIFATRNFAKKAVSGLGIMLAGIVLWAVGFPEDAKPSTLPVEVINTLVLVYLPVLIFLYLVSCYVMRFYKIDKQKHEQNVSRTAS
jgi:GPH family glycoside/pentoside/hexuronide:cation symporter